MERKSYRWCAVPHCRNTSITSPNKLFIDVPRKADVRKKWLDLARRNFDGMSINSPIYFCEDHFDLPSVMENYMRYHVMGSVKKKMLKPGCLPSKFQCQSDRKRSLPSTSTSRPAAVKRQRLATIHEILHESQIGNKENTALSDDVLTGNIKEGYKHQPKREDKGVQALVKSKCFRRKYTQTNYNFKNTATSPFKMWTSTKATSPFKVEHVGPSKTSVFERNRALMEGLDSDTSLNTASTSSQPSSPSIKSLQGQTSSSPCSSLDEAESEIKLERERKQVLHYMYKKIKDNPRFYIGTPKECYFLIDLIHQNTSIQIEHILLCLKKIRLNTTFSELGDQFGMSTSYAGKIFFKNIPIIANNLQPFLVHLDKEKIKRSLPIAFRHRYNKVTCIIDCFKIDIEKPTKSLNQALTWSEYKKANTIKYLISSTPNGLVNYISPGYGGRISDTLLVETCKFLTTLKPGSTVLADRGFKHVEQLLNEKQCSLLRPPSVAQGAKLTKQDVLKTKQIASLRIHIERVIRRIHEFSMLKPHSVLNNNLIRVLDDCVVIACALIKLQDGIVQ